MQRRCEPELMDLPEEAQAYAAADFSDVNAAFVERLLELAEGLDEAKAIDLGTGPGDVALRVARARSRWQIDAVDASPAMIDIARGCQPSAANVRLHLADAKSTGLAAGAYDVIFSNSLLHHLPDPLPLWREIRRLARPGAIVFLRDLARPESEESARRIVDERARGESKLLQEEFYRSLLAAFTPQEVRDQLRASGLSRLKVEPSSDRHLDVFGVV